MILIDSHVNLHSDAFAEDRDAVIARAREAGVAGMLTISDRLTSTDAIREVSRSRPYIWRSVGVHPHYAVDAAELSPAELVALAEEDDVIGIGECGLDFYYEHSCRDVQATVFSAHIAAAQATGLPLIIHTRDADEAMRAALTSAYAAAPFTPLLHCYTGGPELAAAAVALGGYVSFSGILTFKNAEAVRAVAEATPLDRIIIETDCPYLAPIPFRGRRCEPAHLTHVAAKLAEVKGVEPKEAAAATTENFFRLFAKADRAALAP